MDGTLLRHLENLRADASEERRSRRGPPAYPRGRPGSGRSRDPRRAADRCGHRHAPLARRPGRAGVHRRHRPPRSTPLQTCCQPCSAGVTCHAVMTCPLRHHSTAELHRAHRPPHRAAPRQSPDPDGAPVQDTEPLEDTDGVYEQFPEQFHDVADALRTRRIPPGGKARLGDLLGDADELFAPRRRPGRRRPLPCWPAPAKRRGRRLRLLLCLDAMMLWQPGRRSR